MKYPNKGTVNSRLYHIWWNMRQRCYYHKATSYKRYGAKGITMCDEWLKDFMSFYNWSMENGYSDELTIDRIDGNGNYEPQNCRWTTYKEQANNTSTNVIIELNGVKHSLAEWSDITGLNQSTIIQRRRRGWSDIKSITTPPFKDQQKHFTEEEMNNMIGDHNNGMTFSQMAIKYGANRNMISKLIRGLRDWR